ncbi:glycogen/starch/alpha-glucan phosphorylase [Nordella sp. HKS 07]|uniref:glycogen/starch/alpha-glucan phosphorylase n=1 Tax=Nordella sp. HKS 07 TaxID=2712222 RepID=UPI0013E16D7A|nr:glycogen/starch/alpha-glucan phosphorylase [Nordella sp. HKS 07]QIG52067.1 glycogen/starch/alpha-glucan phosphorylase [Nordella sp. HKS 07]
MVQTVTQIHPDAPKPAPRRTDAATLRSEILEKLAYTVGKDPLVARNHDWLAATIHAVRDRVIDHWMNSTRDAYAKSAKRVYYLSLEFLIGRLLRDAMSNLGLVEPVTQALKSLNVDLDLVEALEPDAALGNGGLGRLAACFMESMASVGIPAYGYGIRYQHGLFKQKIKDGQQIELPEDWLAHGNPWEFERREAAYDIGFGGTVETVERDDNSLKHSWRPSETVQAVAFDTPIAGWRGKRVNTLRLWSAQALDPIRLDAFNRGDHLGALAEQNRAETITQVLYPSDSTPAGQELRLRQEYFFVSASLQDLLRRHVKQFGSLESLPEKVAIQLNDTHPAVAVAELMRILVDLNGLDWDAAWKLTTAAISYTNHTLLPEALETWPVHLFERLLPRHMQIIYAINAKLLQEARSRSASDAQLAALSLIDEHDGRRVRMGQLAFAGSHKVNGVSGLHTELMKSTVFRDLNDLFPDRITNKTNGITPRRWLFQANDGLTKLVTEAIGDKVLDDLDLLVDLNKLAGDAAFQARFAEVKRANKMRLAREVQERMGLKVDPSALFDVQVKRIHEYKRQLLNILETISSYNQIRSHPEKDWVPRVKIFGGKAAASYSQAKLIIRLANDVARVINADPAVRGLIKVAFIPNYNVSLAELIVPAADLSEQISTAGMEASGTGNMKFALNGALTIGTLDGANVEIREHVGADNIVIFGMTAEEVAQRRAQGYAPRAVIETTPELRDVLNMLGAGVFSPGEPDRYKGIIDALNSSDWFMVAADFAAYSRAQRQVDDLWVDPRRWHEKVILNTANMAWFSADRTIRDYAREIWTVPSL